MKLPRSDPAGTGGWARAATLEADLSDPATSGMLFDAAEQQPGPVDILVNNATGWLADTFAPSGTDRLCRSLRPGDRRQLGQQFIVAAMSAALLIGEFAARAGAGSSG